LYTLTRRGFCGSYIVHPRAILSFSRPVWYWKSRCVDVGWKCLGSLQRNSLKICFKTGDWLLGGEGIFRKESIHITVTDICENNLSSKYVVRVKPYELNVHSLCTQKAVRVGDVMYISSYNRKFYFQNYRNIFFRIWNWVYTLNIYLEDKW